MVYIKVQHNGVIVGAEAIEEPGYVRNQKDGIIRCTLPTAQGIIAGDGSRIYQLADREALTGVEYELLSASFVDVTEYERLSEEISAPEEETGESEQEQQSESEVMSDLDMKVELLNLRSEVDMLKQGPIQDEATTRFYQTLSDSSTNSIAKIRAAAQQYLDDTAHSEGVDNNV